ncbi:MAG: DUF1049 domain-containing protein [Candidatus Omnitrophica bacterium]|nr:DUF1049 domain-containing protein [Candidatus Omnitrophota bacterium]
MKPKIMLLLGVAVLAGIILLQNTQVVSFQVLFWTISMSRIIFFTLLLLIGFGLGYFCGRKYWEA